MSLIELREVEKQARVPPLREPTRSQEVNAKKNAGLAAVGMTGLFVASGSVWVGLVVAGSTKSEKRGTAVAVPLFVLGRVTG